MLVDVLYDGSHKAYAYEAPDHVKVGDYVKIPETPFGDPRYARVIRLDSQYEGPVKSVLGIVGDTTLDPLDNDDEV